MARLGEQQKEAVLRSGGRYNRKLPFRHHLIAHSAAMQISHIKKSGTRAIAANMTLDRRALRRASLLHYSARDHVSRALTSTSTQTATAPGNVMHHRHRSGVPARPIISIATTTRARRFNTDR
jgi:hypothetical protein